MRPGWCDGLVGARWCVWGLRKVESRGSVLGLLQVVWVSSLFPGVLVLLTHTLSCLFSHLSPTEPRWGRSATRDGRQTV